jgi:hypothetical protein
MPLDPNRYEKYSIHQLMGLPGNAGLQIKSDDRDVLFCKMKSFNVKDDIVLFSDKECTSEEFVRVKAAPQSGVSFNYDVIDSTNGKKIAGFKGNPWSPFRVRESWTLTGADGQDIGNISEQNMLMAALRHVLTVAPAIYKANISLPDSTSVAVAKIVHQRDINVLWLDCGLDTARRLDRKVAIAAGAAICVAKAARI